MSQKAIIYRMHMKDHICPSGLKALDLLKKNGFEIEDHPLKSREETDQFKEKYDVQTTPQIFIEGKRIGGLEDLKQHLGKEVKQEKSYTPVLVVFAIALLISISYAVSMHNSSLFYIFKNFIVLSMVLLGMLKLRDIQSFTDQFLSYDLLAARWVRYAYIYPFAECISGLLMISGRLTLLSSSIMIIIGSIGAISVFKAVYIDKRDLKCACVGGNSNVPLGFVSLTENIMMLGMGILMIAFLI